MKFRHILTFLLFSISANAQTAVRSLNGSATNITLKGTTQFKTPSGGNDVIITQSGETITFNSTSNPFTSPFTITGNGIFGDGSGLTNLAFPAGPTYVFNGKATFVSNVFFNVTSYSTNSAASETTIDLAKSYRAFATNNNTAFSGLANIEAARTNIQSVNIFITNSSAAATTITMDAQFQNMNASEGNTLFVTNVGHLLVFFYPGFGTNFYFKSR